MAKKFPVLKGKLILAPMHKVTNLAFRLMCKKYGASLVSTEMLSANAISRGNKAILKKALTDESEKPVVAQIFGQNTDCIIKAGKILEKKFDVIDLNLGCPSKKIISQGGGGALLRRKNKIREILKNLVDNIKIPVSVKIRSGIDKKINAIEIAEICEKSGVSAVIIHARNVEQGYSGKADWKIIADIKRVLKIPIIGNGDIWRGEDAKKMFEETHCDYVMIGRGAIGNPFIFREIEEYLKSGKILKQKKEEKIEDFFEYIELCKKFGIFSIIDAKMRAQEFTKGMTGSSKLRKKLNDIKYWEEIEKLMSNFKKDIF